MAGKILVVDDKPEVIESVLAWLRQEGYDVIVTTWSDVRRVEQVQPDLLLLSVASPDLDGFAICRQLRRNSGTANIPVVLVTTQNGSQDRMNGVLAGANDFISVPFQINDVQRRLKAILNAGTAALVENRRLLEETCQAALAILPCSLAWLLSAEGNTLRSRAIAAERGTSASEVFLRLASGGALGSPTFPLEVSNNPLAEVTLSSAPSINIPLAQIRVLPNSQTLHRAFKQLRLVVVHFLPLVSSGQLIGLFVLGARDMYDTSSARGQNILNALISQAATVVSNTLLVTDLALREERMKEEQAFRKMVLDTMGDGLVVINEKAQIRYVNNRLLRMSGYTREELYDNSVGAIFHPEGREYLVRGLQRLGRDTVSFSQQLVTKDGRVVPVLMSRATTGSSVASGFSTVLVLSDLTEQKRREQALERRGQRLRSLNRTARTVASAQKLSELVNFILQSALEVIQCSNACLYLKPEGESDMLTVVAAEGPQASALLGASLRIGEGIAGQVAYDRQPRLVASVQPEAGWARYIEREGSSVVAVPLIIMDQVIGVLETINKIEGPFIQDDIEILENLAAASAIAIQNVRLLEQRQRRVSELTTLLEVSAAVSSTLQIGSVLELVTRRLLRSLNVARCSIFAWDSPANQLVVLAEGCDAFWEVGQGPARALTPLDLSVLQEGKTKVAYALDPTLERRVREYLARSGMRAALLIPLRMGQAIVGLIELYSAGEKQSFAPEQIQAVEEVILSWHQQIRSLGVDWHYKDHLTDLGNFVLQTSGMSWCAISSWEHGTLRQLREMGFVLWEDNLDERHGVIYRLDDYPTLARSLRTGSPITLHPDILHDDVHERTLLAQSGTASGLVTPLVIRGEASGIIQLLDISPHRQFDIAEISLCQGIANIVANSLDNARLFQSLERRANALQAAYDQLRDLDQTKTNLISNLSHELQTPVQQALFVIDLMIDNYYGEFTAAQREPLEQLMAHLNRLGDIVRSLVTLRTLDTQPMTFKEAHLEEILNQSVQNLLAKANRAGRRIAATIPKDLPQIRADSTRLVEVFDALIDNAIKFSPRSEQVDVRVEDLGGPILQVCIEDRGIGIPLDEYEKIWQRGYQVEGSLTRRFGGAGIGLAIARQTIEAHGGKIWVESTPGTGSKFFVSLPKLSNLAW